MFNARTWRVGMVGGLVTSWFIVNNQQTQFVFSRNKPSKNICDFM